MSSAEQVIACIEAAGGALAICGDRIYCRLPEAAAPLLEELRVRREEVLIILRARSATPPVPMGVRLISWDLKNPPVLIEMSGVVTDPEKFARTTLDQLRAALDNPKRWVGWSVTQLIERLAQVGVTVLLEKELSPQ